MAKAKYFLLEDQNVYQKSEEDELIKAAKAVQKELKKENYDALASANKHLVSALNQMKTVIFSLKDWDYYLESRYDDQNITEIQLKKYKGKDTHLVIPSVIHGWKVKVIGKGVNHPSIQSIKFEERRNQKVIFDGNFNTNLKSLDVSGLKVLYINIFENCKSLESIQGLDRWDMSNLTELNFLFNNCVSLKTIQGIEQWNMTRFSDISGLFRNCKALEKVPAIQNWNVKNIKYASSMFAGCTSLKDLSAWDTKKIRNMNSMFEDCTSLEDISSISRWKLNNVETVASMFENCENLVSANIRNWYMPKLETTSLMFYNCHQLKEANLEHWVSSKNYVDFSRMFENCERLESVNLSTNSYAVGNLDSTFYGCEHLKEIKGLENDFFLHLTLL